MNVIIEAPFQVNEHQKEAINKKMESLDKFNARISKSVVYIKMMDDSGPNTYTSEVELIMPGPDIFASASDSDILKSFSKAFKQAKTQLLKRKDQLKDLH